MKIIEKISTIILSHEGYQKLTGKLYNGASTLLELFENKVSESPNEDILGAINSNNEIEYMTYKEVDYCTRKLGHYFSKITSPGDTIGIASENRPEWLITEFATYFAKCTNTSFHIDFDKFAMSYACLLTKIKILVTSSKMIESIILKIQNGYLKEHILLEKIILMDYDDKAIELCRQEGYEVITLPQILFNDFLPHNPNLESSANNCYDATTIVEKVKKYLIHNENYVIPIDQSRDKPSSQDIASFCFTNGTTGISKGVILTHSNFIYQIEGFYQGSEHFGLFDLSSSDVYISYLPLSHVLERLCVAICFAKGTKIGFYRGDNTGLLKDLQIIAPSFIPTTPYVLRSFYEKIESKVSSFNLQKRSIFKAALDLKIRLQRYGIFQMKPLDNLIFKEVINSFGGNLRGCICGGASADPYIIKYLQAVLNIRIFQGYGMTEGLGANIISTVDDISSSSVGIPFPTTIIKLVNLDESHVNANFATPMKVHMKGYSVTSGYLQPTEDDYKLLNENEEYAKVGKVLKLDSEGYIITGDIATYENGKLQILGKYKNLIKLQNEEYISPDDIEAKLQSFFKFKGVNLFN